MPPVLDEATRDFRLADAPVEDLSQSHYLDRDVLAAVREDLAHTYYPSHIQRPPHNFGSPGHGKLSSAQWRSVCMISLIITLVRLWGPSHGAKASSTAAAANLALLKNFVDLVVAVDCATRRSMCKERARKYDSHMYSYLCGLREIFAHQLVPNHHMAMHLGECLAAFGPVHSWWTFPFERYNGLIAHKRTNAKPCKCCLTALYDKCISDRGLDEMPLTLLRSFTIGSTLRWLMSTIQWPDAPYFRDMMARFNHAHGEALGDMYSEPKEELGQRRTSPHRSVLDHTVYARLLQTINERGRLQFSSRHTPSDTLNPILDDTAQTVVKFEDNGQTFGTSTRGKRNSFILFRAPGTDGATPGQIVDIFLHTRLEGSVRVEEPFFVVKAFSPLQRAHEPFDPYRTFPDLDTRLYYGSLANATPHVLKRDDIISHFAAFFYVPTGIERDCVVVRSLDQV